jgi:hypothetical protein
MANTLGAYNPIFYAQEALIQLEKSLGIASRIHLGYDQERRAFDRGETINIRRPASFTAQDAPVTAPGDFVTETVSITLAFWREVKFKLTDKELTFTGQRIIDEHIRPAAVALADDIDQKLAALIIQVPWYVKEANAQAPGKSVADITGPRKVLFDNKAPLEEGRLHFMVGGAMEKELLELSNFTQWQGSGPSGEMAQRRGSLGMRYGFEFFANQNAPTYTGSTTTDYAGAVDLVAGYPIGATTVHIDSMASADLLKKGDIVKFANHAQQYVLTADAQLATNEADINIFPALKAAVVNAETLLYTKGTGIQQTAFHRNFAALVTAPLSELGNELGARIASVQDPITGLSLRSRLYYDGVNSAVHVALDVLYGVQILDPNLAVRLGTFTNA